MANKTDKRKQSLYFNAQVLDLLQAEAKRLDRSLSWVVQRCVKVAMPEIAEIPGIEDLG
jgi:uncharacterized small protein (TIGR04563 family)